MDPQEYRKQIESEIAAAGDPQAANKLDGQDQAAVLRRVVDSQGESYSQDDRTKLADILGDINLPPEARAAALSSLCQQHTDGSTVERLIAYLGDNTEVPEVRLSALQCLQVAAFHVENFRQYAASFTAALRAAVGSGDPKLAEAALTSLSYRRDDYGKEKLLEGLQAPAKALVPEETALRLLANDIHSEVSSVARKIVERNPGENVKALALRLLGSDGESVGLLSNIVGDKSESSGVRMQAAAALHALRPDSFVERAKELLNDDNDDEDLRAALLTGVAQTEAFVDDLGLRDKVQKLRANTASSALRQLADKHLETTGTKELFQGLKSRLSRRLSE